MTQREPHGGNPVLGDPLAGLSRPAGDPAGVRSRCTDFRSAAAQLEDLGSLMGVYIGGVAAKWGGDGAAAFLTRAGTLPRSYRHVAGGYRAAAGALEAYAGALADAQHAFDQARALVVADDARQRAVLAADPHAVADPLSPDRVRARRMVEHSLGQLKGASLGAVRALRAWEAQEGRRPAARPDIYRDMGSSLRQAWDGFYAAGSSDLGDLLASLPYLNPIGQSIAYYQESQRMWSDPGGYVRAQVYDTFDVGDLEAGNDARWLGTMAVRLPERIIEKRLGLVMHEPHRHGHGDDEEPALPSLGAPPAPGTTPQDPADDNVEGGGGAW